MEQFRALLEERLAARGAAARLADESGVPPNVISRWRAGVTRPTPDNLRKVAPHLGVAYEELLRMCEYLAGAVNARERVSARQRAIRDDLDRWLAAVGPEHEELFWSHLKSQGESTVALIRRMDSQGTTAINSGGGTADNGADKPVVGRPGENGHGQDESGSGPITRAKQRRELVGAGAPTMGAALPQAA